jgi:Ca-activated chloride channel family protein
MRPALLIAIWTFLVVPMGHAQSEVTLEAVTDRQLYQENSANHIHVEARIRAGGLPPTSNPRNIALVVDRSGTMAGEPVEALRAALLAGLNSLAANDIISVVLFGSEVETLIEAQRGAPIPNLEALIAQIEPAGGAALYDALNQGAAQLRRHAAPEVINHLILITDGPPTKGPREFEDFARLADVFAREGMMLSTIGLGADFNEDLLAAMARTGQGRFRYVEHPSMLSTALVAELTRRPALLGRDAVLTFEFRRFARKVHSHGAYVGALDHTSVTYRFPQLMADEELKVLASAEIEPAQAQVFLPELVTVRLRWKDIQTGESREISRVLSTHFTHDIRAIRNSIDSAVTRTKGAIVIVEGLQQAIEEMDEGSSRGALRALRSARSEARDMNFYLDNPSITADIGRLDAFLSAAETRDLGPLDRKILRSGLLNQFDSPAATPDSKR